MAHHKDRCPQNTFVFWGYMVFLLICLMPLLVLVYMAVAHPCIRYDGVDADGRPVCRETR